MMDEHRFDEWTRALAAGVSRRRVIGAVAGALAAALGTGRADARGDKVPICHQTSSATNPYTYILVSDNPNGPHSRHAGDVINVDLQSDPNHCGACGHNCDDGDPCTVDSCVGSQCVQTPKDCSGLDDQCNVGVCQATDGACVTQPKAIGSGCDDGDACTRADACDGSGNCVGGEPVVCAASDECHEAGSCDPATGLCSDPPKPDGTRCGNDNACDGTETCQGGVCTPGTSVVCQPSDQCHDVGTCDPATGLCSDPAKPDGSPCETGNRCTADTCQGGSCQQGQVSVTCPQPNECQESIACNPASGECDQVVNRPAGSACGAPAACVEGVSHAADACDGAGTCVRGGDTPCAFGEACVGDTCQAVCLTLQAACDPADNRCCQDEPTFCEVTPGCGLAGVTRCCHLSGDSCTASCDCCDLDVCENNRCCHPAGAECNIFAVEGCCDGLACDGGTCQTTCLPNGAACSPFEALRCCAGSECIEEVCRRECTNGARRCAVGADCCPSDRACCNGICCPAGQHCCGGTCRDVQADDNNCGGCGNICPIDKICVDGVCRLAVCKANDDDCDEASDCCSGLCNGSVCFCSPAGFPVGDTCETDANCCQGRCIAGFCVCFPAAFPPAPGLNGPCFSDRDCCTGSCLLDPTGNVGLCTCRPLGVPCDNQFQCCSGNCNATPFGGRICSPFD